MWKIAATAIALASGVGTASGIEIAEWTPGGLDHPFSLALLPDGSMLVTEKGGRIAVISPTGDIVRKVAVPGFTQLMEIIPDPKFSENRKVFLCGVSSGEPSTVFVVSAVLGDTAAMSNHVVVFTSTPQKEYGACKMALNDGSLFLSIGNGAVVPSALAQDPNSTEGKVLKIAVSSETLWTQIWSSGHRNIEGMAASPDGKLWAHEHGPRGGDELNLLNRRGANYGWPMQSYGVNYTGLPLDGSYCDCVKPVYYWTPSIAPSGMAFWQDALWIGALRGRALIRLDIQGDAVRNEQRFDMKYRVRDIRSAAKRNPAVDPLWVLTDGDDAKILRVWN